MVRAFLFDWLKKRRSIIANYPWPYFDGVSQHDHSSPGVGGVLYISKDLKFQFREALGVRSNNFAELYALTLLLLVTVEKKLKVLQVFGDTKVIIYWITWETVAQTPFFGI